MSAQTTTRQKIEELQLQIQNLKSGAVEELKAKIKEAKAIVADLEKELAELTGSPVESPVKAKRTRRASFTDEELHASIRTVLAENKTGISAAGIAKTLNISYPRVAKYISDAFIKDPKIFKKTGTGKSSRLFLP